MDQLLDSKEKKKAFFKRQQKKASSSLSWTLELQNKSPTVDTWDLCAAHVAFYTLGIR